MDGSILQHHPLVQKDKCTSSNVSVVSSVDSLKQLWSVMSKMRLVQMGLL